MIRRNELVETQNRLLRVCNHSNSFCELIHLTDEHANMFEDASAKIFGDGGGSK